MSGAWPLSRERKHGGELRERPQREVELGGGVVVVEKHLRSMESRMIGAGRRWTGCEDITTRGWLRSSGLTIHLRG